MVLRKIERSGDHDHTFREGDSTLFEQDRMSFHDSNTYQESNPNDTFGVSPVKSNPAPYAYANTAAEPVSNFHSRIHHLRTTSGAGSGSVRVTKTKHAIQSMR